MSDDEQRAQLVAGLRELADWYEQHPTMPVPSYPDFAHCVLTGDDKAGSAEVRKMARLLGVKPYGNGHRVTADRRFGAVAFRAFYVPCAEMALHQAETSYQGCIEPYESDAAAVQP